MSCSEIEVTMKIGKTFTFAIGVIGAVVAVVQLTGCASASAIRVGSYNVRTASGDRGTVNAWDGRKEDLVELVRSFDLDVFGMQEVMPEQARYFREKFPEWDFVGDHRAADRVSDEASPVFFRRDRFEPLKSGTFWLSETPDVPGSKSWGTACPRVCSYLVLRDRRTDRIFCFANTHTDHISAEAREKGMMLVINRMRSIGAGSPVIFTGDHNCPPSAAPAVMVRKVLRDARDITEIADPGPANTFNAFGRYLEGPDFGNGASSRRRIDYIYVSDGVKVRDFRTVGDWRHGSELFPSDHFPVVATVELLED